MKGQPPPFKIVKGKQSKIDTYNEYFERVLAENYDIGKEVSLIGLLDREVDQLDKHPNTDIRAKANFLINLITAYIKLGEYDRLIRVAKPLSQLQKLIGDLKLRCRAILNVSNAFFYNEDYEIAAMTSEAAIKLLSGKDRQEQDRKEASDLVDLLAKAYMMRGLSRWLSSVPIQTDDNGSLSEKMESLDEAERSFEQGSLLYGKNDSLGTPQEKIQFLERLRQVRDAKEKCMSFIKKSKFRPIEDSNTMQYSSVSQISGEKSFRIKNLTRKKESSQSNALQSPEERPISKIKLQKYHIQKPNPRKDSHITDQFNESRDKRTSIQGVFIKAGIKHQRPGNRRLKSGKQEAHSVELNKEENQENNKGPGLRKSITIKKKPSSDQMELESQTDNKSSPQTQKSNKYLASDKDHSSGRRQGNSIKHDSRSSLGEREESEDEMLEEEIHESKTTSPEREKEEQIQAMQRQIEELSKQKEMLERITQNKDLLEKRMLEMFMQNMPMAWFQNQQMLMPQYQQPIYPGYPRWPMPHDQSEIQMLPSHLNSSSMLPQLQQMRMQEPHMRGGLNSYLTVPGQHQASPSGRQPVVVVSQAQNHYKQFDGEFEPTRIDYTRNDYTKNDFNNESHIISRSNPEAGMEISRDLRSEQQMLKGIPSANQLTGTTMGNSQYLMVNQSNNATLQNQNVSEIALRNTSLTPGQTIFNETSSMEGETIVLQTHQLTLRNYRERSERSRMMSSKGIYLADFDLNMPLLIEDFRRTIKNSTHCFNKSVIIENLCYKIKLQISCEDDKFTAIMCPTPYNENDPAELPPSMSDINFEREHLQEEQFIEMLKQISVMDKIFPIDSIFTLGTFNELIERIVMPTLIMNINDSKTTIKLEAWPFCIDIISDIETRFAGRQASQWLYHMYDNNFRIFVHLIEDAPLENEDEDYPQEGVMFPNVAIELAFDPVDFHLFFEGTADQQPEEIFLKFEAEYKQAKEDSTRSELVAGFKKDVHESLCRKAKFEISERQLDDQILANINQSEDLDREPPAENKEIVSFVMELLLGSIQTMYDEIAVEIFSDGFYNIGRYCRIWNKMKKILIFLLQDKPEERKVILYSQLFVLSDSYGQIIQKMPYGMIEVPYDWFEISFHVSLEGAEWTDKLIVFKFLTDSLTIRPIEIKTGSKSPEEEDNGDPENLDSYEIKVSSTQVIASRTLYFIKEYATPTTLRLLVLNGVPIGISVMMYDVRLCEEFPVCFLIIHPHVWRKEGPLENFNSDGIGDQDVGELDFIMQKFFLLQFLESGGWEALGANIQPYIDHALEKGMKAEDFFFDSFEYFL